MIQAIETFYSGCLFRSRLEARWAVFFDTAEIRWEYEPQGYLCDGKPYLPDFFLPDAGTWIEVKGDENALDRSLMRSAARDLPWCEPTGNFRGPKLVVVGPIPDPDKVWDWGWCCPSAPEKNEMAWCGFSYFHEESAIFGLADVTADEYRGYYRLHPRRWLTPLAFAWSDYPRDVRISHAYLAARSARFEHRRKRS
jgi:hypothetical protein